MVQGKIFIKKNCYNSWKFKNLLLASDEFVIHEGHKLGDKPLTLELCAEELIKLKQEAEKIRDEHAEDIFWPLINSCLVTVYTSIARRKLDSYSDSKKKSESLVSKLEADNNENKGKISVLNEVKSKISSNLKNTEQSLFDKVKSTVKEITTSKTSENEQVNDEEFIKLRNQIVNDSNEIIENMKEIENNQENNFQEYLKKLGDALINLRKLRNYSN